MAGDSAPVIDVTARSLDLVSVVMHPSGAAATVGRELLQWLGHKSINDTSFSQVMTAGKGIAYPNSNGSKVLGRLGQTASVLKGVRLVLPSTFGRAVLRDPELRWLATTEAVILQYHDMQYATQTLCDLFIDATEEQKDISLMTALVQPIIEEAVHSIALHTTNSTPDFVRLPDVLQKLGQHLMTAKALFGSISAIQRILSNDIFVHMQYCVADLLSWIYHHWSGQLLVVNNNEKIFNENLGPEISKGKRSLTVVIENSCAAVGRCYDFNHERGCVSVGTTHDSAFVDASFEPSFKTESTSRAHLPNTSVERSKLYEIADRNPYVRYYLTINEKEDIAAQRSAQEIVRSIMALHVVPTGGTTLRIQLTPEGTPSFQWWTVCVPSLLQQDNLASESAPIRPLYRPRSKAESLALKGVDTRKIPPVSKQAEMRGRGYYQLPAICKLYPEIADAMALAKQRCECGCRKGTSSSDVGDGGAGCRQILMAAQILLYIAHALAEAAGAEDVSNVHGIDSAKGLIDAAMEFLGTIATDGYISWDLWFRLAASAITGLRQNIWAKRYRWDAQNLSTQEPMFIISGSITVAPQWFDLNQALNLRHSWGVKTLTGSVHGVIDEMALVEAQPTGRNAGPFTPELFAISRGYVDGDRIDIQTHVWRVDDPIYRHATLVQAGTGARILSPIDVYSGYMRAPRPTCSHAEDETTEAYVWGMEEIIRYWPGRWSPGSLHAHVALVEDFALKQNVAIGLSAGTCVLKTDRCCLGCLVEEGRRLGFAAIHCGHETKLLEAPFSSRPSDEGGSRVIQISPQVMPERPKAIEASR
ncbi:hypothetical protein DL765_001094 [Monosporascus sp. GIB2]|nr:hypothetical protein DL765_001094 [Monosporascus sp. GIB2]